MKSTNHTYTEGGGYTTKAFTLIELLVVIAIIGILASVVIASLNSARTKGRVSAIKANLKNLQTQAYMYFNENGTYVGLCSYNTSGVTAHPSIQPMIDALIAIAGANRVRCVVRTSEIPTIASPHYTASDMLEEKNFGVAVYFNDTHYGVDASSVMTLDTAIIGPTSSWIDALNICAFTGKRAPNVEVLKAINDYGARNGGLGFTTNVFWSSTGAASNTDAYLQSFDTGNIRRQSSSSAIYYVRCAS